MHRVHPFATAINRAVVNQAVGFLRALERVPETISTPQKKQHLEAKTEGSDPHPFEVLLQNLVDPVAALKEPSWICNDPLKAKSTQVKKHVPRTSKNKIQVQVDMVVRFFPLKLRSVEYYTYTEKKKRNNLIEHIQIGAWLLSASLC